MLRGYGEFGHIAGMMECLPTVSPGQFQRGGEDGIIASRSPNTNPKSTVNLLMKEVHPDLALKSVHPQAGSLEFGP